MMRSLVALLALVVLTAPARIMSPALPALERMIGQMIVVGFSGSEPLHGNVLQTRRQIAEGRIGGVMLLGRNVTDAAGTRRLIAALTHAATDLPLLVAVDQEGGRVARLRWRTGVTPFPSARRVSETMDPAQAAALYEKGARDLAALGFNLNFGPVVDVDVNPFNPVIGRLGRSYSSEPARVAHYAGAFVQGHRKAGVLTALKHFPGHGSSTRDSHHGTTDITETWSEDELLPFASLIAKGQADIVMTGHLLHRDHEATLPATLSHRIVTGLLRERLGFDGVVIADDLQMGAVRRHFSEEEAAVAAIRAGVDILLFSRDRAIDPTLVDRVMGAVAVAARRDPRLRERIERSHARIVALKARLGGARLGGARLGEAGHTALH